MLLLLSNLINIAVISATSALSLFLLWLAIEGNVANWHMLQSKGQCHPAPQRPQLSTILISKMARARARVTMSSANLILALVYEG